MAKISLILFSRYCHRTIFLLLRYRDLRQLFEFASVALKVTQVPNIAAITKEDRSSLEITLMWPCFQAKQWLIIALQCWGDVLSVFQAETENSGTGHLCHYKRHWRELIKVAHVAVALKRHFLTKFCIKFLTNATVLRLRSKYPGIII